MVSISKLLRQIKHVSQQDADEIVQRAKLQGRELDRYERAVAAANIGDAVTAEDAEWILAMLGDVD